MLRRQFLLATAASIQAAIDSRFRSGGGVVHIPAGRHVTGTIRLKSNVTLHLDPGAVLVGSPNLADYPPLTASYRSYTDTYTEKSLLYAENAENVTIEGSGTIDGQGTAFKGAYKVRPYLARFVACRNVTVKDVTFRDSPM